MVLEQTFLQFGPELQKTLLNALKKYFFRQLDQFFRALKKIEQNGSYVVLGEFTNFLISVKLKYSIIFYFFKKFSSQQYLFSAR